MHCIKTNLWFRTYFHDFLLFFSCVLFRVSEFLDLKASLRTLFTKKSLFVSLLCELLSSRVPLRLYPAPCLLLWPGGGAAFSPTGKWSAPRSHPSRLCLRTPGWPSPCPAQLAGTAAPSVGTWPYALKPCSTWSTWVWRACCTCSAASKYCLTRSSTLSPSTAVLFITLL